MTTTAPITNDSTVMAIDDTIMKQQQLTNRGDLPCNVKNSTENETDR